MSNKWCDKLVVYLMSFLVVLNHSHISLTAVSPFDDCDVYLSNFTLLIVFWTFHAQKVRHCMSMKHFHMGILGESNILGSTVKNAVIYHQNLHHSPNILRNITFPTHYAYVARTQVWVSDTSTYLGVKTFF